MSRAFGAAAVAALAALGVITLVALTSDDDVVVLELEPGQCFNLPPALRDGGDDITVITKVPCAEPHEAEVVADGELNADRATPRGDANSLLEEVNRRCLDAVAGDPVLVADYGLLPVVANQASWDTFLGRFLCVAVPFGGGTTSGSVTPAR